MPAEFAVSSRLDASAEEVWRRVTTAAGVNAELMPLARMTVPRGVEDFDIGDVSPPATIGRSWILLFGLVPIDWDRIHLVGVEPGRGFHERSEMLTQRLWEHRRALAPVGTGACTVTDRVSFEPRLPFLAPLLRPLFVSVFRHRHRRLRRHFGGAPL